MKTKLIVSLVATISALAAFPAAASGNVAEGEKKAAACAACHGPAGAKPIQPDYPILAGQHYDYLVAVLNQYKTGKRKNEVMKGFAAALSPKDIRDLAAYYAAQKSDLKMKY
jgi:cytochrome c553